MVTETINNSNPSNKFSSISTVAQRLSTGLTMSGPIVYLSRGVGQAARQVLQKGGLEAQRKLADISHKIAGPIVVKLHHEFLASKERNSSKLLVGGEGLGYPRSLHSTKVQPRQGGARLLKQKPVNIVFQRVQGGMAQKPVKRTNLMRTSLPGGRALGNKTRSNAVVQSPLPSAARFVHQPAAYEVRQIQGGTSLNAHPKIQLKRRNLPGGVNLGVKKVDVSDFTYARVQGGAGLLLNSRKNTQYTPVKKQAIQGGPSQRVRLENVENTIEKQSSQNGPVRSSFGSVTIGRKVYESYIRF